jgi:hypothetical protein
MKSERSISEMRQEKNGIDAHVRSMRSRQSKTKRETGREDMRHVVDTKISKETLEAGFFQKGVSRKAEKCGERPNLTDPTSPKTAAPASNRQTH